MLVLNHPGSATSGPVYGNATTQLLEFDDNGKFVREIGHGVYGLAYAHGVRYDKYDNLWVVDKGAHTAIRFNPAGYVTLNLGRRPEGPDDPEELYYRGNGLGRGSNPGRPPSEHVDGMFRSPTDIAWDSDDNIYISDGYVNSRVAKFDKHGNWIKSWGSRGTSGAHADENPGQFNVPHNIGIDRQNNVYVADRGNRRIQVFDRDGRLQAAHRAERAVRQEASSCPRQPEPESAGRDAALDDLHHAGRDAVSLHVGPGAGPHLQADARREDRRHARRIRPRASGSSTGSTALRARPRTCSLSPT